jgi:hypothetical protein
MFTSVCAVITACIAGCFGKRKKDDPPVTEDIIIKEEIHMTRQIMIGIFAATILSYLKPRKRRKFRDIKQSTF